jgi:acyl-coenzyme A thioesterase PaaI-like protein
MAEVATPEGFFPFTRPSPLLDPWRPLLARHLDDRVQIGLFVRAPHTNSRGTAHGGLIAALADQTMGMSCAVHLRLRGIDFENLWTSSLTVDYLGSPGIGAWVVFDPQFTYVGKTLCHAEVDVTADGRTVGRGRGAFRVARTQSSSSSS